MSINVTIKGIHYYLPDHVETNACLLKENPSWSLSDLEVKTQIYSRHIAAPGETAADLGYSAAQGLLERGLVDPAEIDYLLFCTESPDHFLPASACILQDRLGLPTSIGAFDINLGCSGYVYGLSLAEALISSGRARNVLLITADTYTKYVHPNDRTVRPLFGDAGAASLISPVEGDLKGLDNFVVGTDGKGASSLIVPAGGQRMPYSEQTKEEKTDPNGNVRTAENLYMDGKALFAFAVSTVPKLTSSVLNKAGWDAADVDWFVYHQANHFMLEQIARFSRVPSEKMICSMNEIGNTVSSSIPIALQKAVEDGSIRKGNRLLLAGFGVGYSWAGCTLQWSE